MTTTTPKNDMINNNGSPTTPTKSSSSGSRSSGRDGCRTIVRLGIGILVVIILVTDSSLLRPMMKMTKATMTTATTSTQAQDCKTIVASSSSSSATSPSSSKTTTTTMPLRHRSSLRLEDVVNDLVVISGYWKIHGTNPKRDISYYTTHINQTLHYLQQEQFPTVVYYHNIQLINNTTTTTTAAVSSSSSFTSSSNKNNDNDDDSSGNGNNDPPLPLGVDDILAHHMMKTKKNNAAANEIEFVYQPIESLLYKESQQLLELCKKQRKLSHFKKGGKCKNDKPSEHYQRYMQSLKEKTISSSSTTTNANNNNDNTINHHSSWLDVITIWISKFQCIQQVMDRYPHKTYFVWMDGALSGRIPIFMNQFLHYTKLYKDSSDDAAEEEGDDDEEAEHHHHAVYFRRSTSCYNHTMVPYRAGVMVGHRRAYQTLINGFYQELHLILKGNERPHLCWDEEMILSQLYYRSFKSKTIFQDLMQPINPFPIQ